MKTTLNNPILLLSALAVGATGAQAQSMSVNSQITLATNPGSGALQTSFFDGNAKYDAPDASGTLGDGTLLDYSFYGNNRDTPSTTLAWVERGAGSANYLSVASDNGTVANAGGSIDWPSYWYDTDPGATFATAADYTGGVPDESIGVASNVTGTVDIASLLSGTVYFMFGTYSEAGSISLTMTGVGQSDFTDSMTWADPGNNNVMFIQSLTFDNTGGLYDEISYEYQNIGADSRGRFAYVALDGVVVPEPSALTLIGLAGLSLLLRRRRS